ncbi:MAG: OsmC family peroxiredoxin [Inquilinus limosus]|uniref:OsmC family peroxiredoxin n=1 Tax=Inquilinus limosus TaxID=171674 RepID=A0A952FM38_9PROT|nr:OsmC family peroxiredoxin [Inquilinus limosus]
MVTRTASARYDGLGPSGKGQVSTQSGVLRHQPYDFTTRFGETPGTNPEELAAAAHAACFTMSLSFALGRAGYKDGTLKTDAAVTISKDGDGFKISRSALTVAAKIDGIDAAEFQRIVSEAESGCPISKLFNTEITLDAKLEPQSQ